MYNFDPYNVLLSIATNIPVLLMTAFVLQGHISLLTLECFNTQTSIANMMHINKCIMYMSDEDISQCLQMEVLSDLTLFLGQI